ncbi:MAG: hypothetical protein JXR27_09590 [Paludibacteraceae bacterium]|nr:hypothetical protein [Paludibacteraceae bacterium]
MKYRTFLLVLLLSFGSVIAQQRRGRHVLYQVSNKEVVQNVFPEAERVEEYNQYWYRICNSSNETLGFAICSRNYCSHIVGYAGETPVIIITDTHFIVRKTAILSNYESPSYLRMLVDRGFFETWNQKHIRKVKEIIPDAVTGATRTAAAIIENVHFLSEKGSGILPEKKAKRATVKR